MVIQWREGAKGGKSRKVSDRTFPLRLIALCAVAVSACSGARETANPNIAAASRAEAGLVAPLKDDTSEEIVSWVDGQVVTDWAAEIAKRERAIEAT